MKPRARHVVPRVTCHACSVSYRKVRRGHGAEAEVSLRRVRAGTWGGSGSSYGPCIGAPDTRSFSLGKFKKNGVGAETPNTPPGLVLCFPVFRKRKARIKSIRGVKLAHGEESARKDPQHPKIRGSRTKESANCSSNIGGAARNPESRAPAQLFGLYPRLCGKASFGAFPFFDETRRRILSLN